MTILNQNSTSQTFFVGWYGTCDTECQNINISTSSFRDKIYKIFQIQSDNLTYVGFDGTIPQNLDSTLQPFLELECGKSYIIILNSGTGSVDLTHFKEVNSGSTDSGRVTQSCTQEPQDPTYELSIDPYIGYEGDIVTVTLTTTNVPENTEVPYTIGGDVDLNDFSPVLTSYNGVFTVGPDGTATQQFTYAEDGVTNETSESFSITLDNITPEVSIFGVLIDTSTTDTVISIDGHGMSGMDSATHEGYDYAWSDIIVNKEGQYSWQITTASGNITPEDFSSVRIDGNEVDYSTLSGTFNVSFWDSTSTQASVHFWVSTVEDSVNEQYESLTLTITYVPDGTSASDTVGIYDMPNPYSTFYQDLPYGETWDPGESVTFELTYNITSEREMVGTSSLINWVITSTGSGQNIDINDIESIERWTDLDTTPVSFDFGPPYGLEQDINGDIEGYFDSYLPNAAENGKSYIKITLKSTAILSGKQMRFKLKDPSPTIGTPSQFDYIF